MIVPKRWYFTLKRGSGNQSFEMVLYLKDKKFYTSLYLHTQYLLSWRQAYWYWFLFNLRKWIKINATLFAYKHVTGTVHLCRLSDEQLD